jgi:hypothetical protein
VSISVGTPAYVNVPDNGAASGTTGSINTTGVSTLYLICIQKGGTSPLTPSDSASNTWTRIGSQISSPGGTLTIDRWYVKGPTTSSTHTFTVTNTSGSSRFQISCYPLTGADPTTPLDQSNTSTASGAPPWSSGSVTVSSGNAALGEIAFSAGCSDAGTETSWSEANGFTVDNSQVFGGGFPHNASGAFGHRTISSAATYNASWTDGATGTPNFAGVIDTFVAGASALVLGAQTATFTQGQMQASFPAAPIRSAPLAALIGNRVLGPLGLGGFAVKSQVNAQAPPNTVGIGALTATFTQGAFSASSTGSATLGAQTATFSQGTFTAGGGATVSMGAQTATFTQGNMSIPGSGTRTTLIAKMNFNFIGFGPVS